MNDFGDFLFISPDFKREIKNEMNFKKMRKSERFAEKTKDFGIYLKSMRKKP